MSPWFCFYHIYLTLRSQQTKMPKLQANTQVSPHKCLICSLTRGARRFSLARQKNFWKILLYPTAARHCGDKNGGLITHPCQHRLNGELGLPPSPGGNKTSLSVLSEVVSERLNRNLELVPPPRRCETPSTILSMCGAMMRHLSLS